MPVITRDDLRTQLKRHEIAPAYILFGQETHLRDLAAKTIVERSFAPDDLRDFNESTYGLNSGEGINAALAAGRQLPMMSRRRVVRVNDIRISATGYRDTLTDTHEAILSAYLDEPPAETVLVMVADELNGVRKMAKLLKEKAVAVEFSRLDDRELAEWARREIADADAVISESTLKYLLSRVEPDVSRLTNEIRKLAAAALPEKTITSELIDALVPFSREISNFDLTDHLVGGRGPQAIRSLTKILTEGAEPLALLGLISYNYRRLLMAKDMMSRGVQRGEVAKTIKVRYNDQETFLAAARRSDMAGLKKAIRRIAEVDLAIKTSVGGSGPAGSRIQVEMLVCELAAL